MGRGPASRTCALEAAAAGAGLPWGAGDPPHQSPALASRVPPGRAQTPLIAPHPSVVPVPVPPHPAVREAPARQPPALLLDVHGQPGADPGRPRRGHSLSGGGCGPRPPRGTLGAPGGHRLGPGPEVWVFRVHRAHEGRLTTEVPTVPLHCPGFRIPPPRVMSFSSPPPHLGAHTLTLAHRNAQCTSQLHTHTLKPILGHRQTCCFCPQAQVLTIRAATFGLSDRFVQG